MNPLQVFQPGRVNLVFTKRGVRYAYQPKQTDPTVRSVGEWVFPSVAYTNGAIQDERAFIKSLKRLVRQEHWRGKPTQIALIGDTVHTQAFTVPSIVTAPEAAAYAHTMMGVTLDLPFEQAKVTAAIVTHNEQENRTDARLYAYPSGKLDVLLKAVKRAGLSVSAAELTAQSTFRYYEQTTKRVPPRVLWGHWNADSLEIAVIEYKRVVFTRHIKFDTDTKQENLSQAEIGRRLDVGVTEVTRVAQFYESNVLEGEAIIDVVVVSGDFMYLADARLRLADRLPDVMIQSVAPSEQSRAHTKERRVQRVKRRRGAHGRSTRSLKEGAFVPKPRELDKYADVLGLARRPVTPKKDPDPSLINFME